jgi:hypothetical protein
MNQKAVFTNEAIKFAIKKSALMAIVLPQGQVYEIDSRLVTGSRAGLEPEREDTLC